MRISRPAGPDRFPTQKIANVKPLTLIPKLKAKLKRSTSIIAFLSTCRADLKAKAVEAGCDHGNAALRVLAEPSQPPPPLRHARRGKRRTTTSRDRCRSAVVRCWLRKCMRRRAFCGPSLFCGHRRVHREQLFQHALQLVQPQRIRAVDLAFAGSSCTSTKIRPRQLPPRPPPSTGNKLPGWPPDHPIRRGRRLHRNASRRRTTGAKLAHDRQ